MTSMPVLTLPSQLRQAKTDSQRRRHVELLREVDIARSRQAVHHRRTSEGLYENAECAR